MQTSQRTGKRARRAGGSSWSMAGAVWVVGAVEEKMTKFTYSLHLAGRLRFVDKRFAACLAVGRITHIMRPNMGSIGGFVACLGPLSASKLDG